MKTLPTRGWSFWAWGRCTATMPQATGETTSCTHKGMKFTVAFNEKVSSRLQTREQGNEGDEEARRAAKAIALCL
ncbi:MAG: hypothetical protein RMX68_021440 [Aulosira sp. ZfuVER01]|nr:hypothetical protein [Aulosira sp. ZfuVER01]MDZ8002690.1 hypothetical protein [Aulosira sp. DedVER01a]MDZ8050632.1 hypothetical protein [Aulosira sp. ZfuCHP01]